VVNWAPVHVESGKAEVVKVAIGTTANQYFLLGRAQIDTGGMLFTQYFDSVSFSLRSPKLTHLQIVGCRVGKWQ